MNRSLTLPTLSSGPGGSTSRLAHPSFPNSIVNQLSVTRSVTAFNITICLSIRQGRANHPAAAPASTATPSNPGGVSKDSGQYHRPQPRIDSRLAFTSPPIAPHRKRTRRPASPRRARPGLHHTGGTREGFPPAPLLDLATGPVTGSRPWILPSDDKWAV